MSEKETLKSDTPGYKIVRKKVRDKEYKGWLKTKDKVLYLVDSKDRDPNATRFRTVTKVKCVECGEVKELEGE